MAEVQGVVVNPSNFQKILSYYPTLEIENTKSEWGARIFPSKDNNLKNHFIMVGSGVLSSEIVSRRLRDQLVHLRISHKGISLRNPIRIE